MDLKRIGYIVTLFSVVLLLIVVVIALIMYNLNGEYEIRGIIFSIIFWGIIMIYFFTPVFLALLFYRKTIIVPSLFVLFFSVIELISILENYPIKYIVIMIPIGSLITILGHLKKNDISRKNFF